MPEPRELPRWAQRLAMIVVYTGLAGYIGFHFWHHGIPDILKARPCDELQPAVSISFVGDRFNPSPITVPRCTPVTIVNNSTTTVDPAIGPHEQHILYPTFNEHPLKPGESMQFTTSVPG